MTAQATPEVRIAELTREIEELQTRLSGLVRERANLRRSVAKTGMRLTDAAKAKISAAHRGKPKSRRTYAKDTDTRGRDGAHSAAAAGDAQAASAHDSTHVDAPAWDDVTQLPTPALDRRYAPVEPRRRIEDARLERELERDGDELDKERAPRVVRGGRY